MSGAPVNVAQVVNVLGRNHPRHAMRQMALALSMHSWGNTPQEDVRLTAARWALANWPAFQAECNRRSRLD